VDIYASSVSYSRHKSENFYNVELICCGDCPNSDHRTRSGSVENEHEIFRRYNYQKSFSAGVDKVETAGRKIPGHGYVVGNICETENPFPFPSKQGLRTLEKIRQTKAFITLVFMTHE